MAVEITETEHIKITQTWVVLDLVEEKGFPKKCGEYLCYMKDGSTVILDFNKDLKVFSTIGTTVDTTSDKQNYEILMWTEIIVPSKVARFREQMNNLQGIGRLSRR